MELNKYNFVIVCSKDYNEKTEFVIDNIKNNYMDGKILFFSLEHEINGLIKNFMLDIGINNLKIIDTPITIEKIKEIINNYNPKIIYIDYLQLIGGATHIKNFSMQQQFILHELYSYTTKFNTRIVVTYLMSAKTSNNDILEELKNYKVLFI